MSAARRLNVAPAIARCTASAFGVAIPFLRAAASPVTIGIGTACAEQRRFRSDSANSQSPTTQIQNAQSSQQQQQSSKETPRQFVMNGVQYPSYAVMLDAYDAQLSSAATQKTDQLRAKQNRLKDAAEGKSAAVEGWWMEYTRVIMPVLIVLWFYLLDEVNHNCAVLTHLQIKEHSKKSNSVRWETI